MSSKRSIDRRQLISGEDYGYLTRAGPTLTASRRFILIVLDAWKREPEDGATIRIVGDADAAAVAFDDGADDGEPESGALAG